jgi:SRSO17 transposase
MATACMFHFNRAIDSGNGLMLDDFSADKALFAGAGKLCPEHVKTFYAMKRIEINRHFMSKEAYGKARITGELKDFNPVTLVLVSGTDRELVWDHLVRDYHYLGYQKLLGHRLKYLAFINNEPVAALSWSAPALKLAPRDCFIGWSVEQRRRHLKQVAGNSRFLVMPWVRIPNMASHVLGLNIARLPLDWQQHFNDRLLLLETFVDGRFHEGTCYKASNWLYLGQTHGSTKQGKGYRYHGSRKEIFLYIVDPEFRNIIGCRQRPAPLPYRPPQTKMKVEELTMLLEHCRWHSGISADFDLDQEDVKTMAQELVAFHEEFHDCYGRIEHHRLGLAYLSGLMSDSPAKSAEPIALEFLDQKSVRPIQMFLKNYKWDHLAMQHTHQRMLAPLIASPGGMITVDPSEFPKKGKESVGVARQYCGNLGKVDNCQSGVFVGYTSEKGYGLLACRLYMPEKWFTEEQKKRRTANLVPEDLFFETKQEIALNLVDDVMATGLFPAKWLGADASFGRDLEFLNSLPETLTYFVSIPSDIQVFTKKPRTGLPPYKGRGRRPSKICVLPGEPQPQTVNQIAKSNRITWKPVVVAEGAKGPIVAKVALMRIYLSRDGLPEGDEQWLFLRKNADGQVKFAISNAPKDISMAELIKASTMRWPIEQCFNEGKDQVGMDYYEHRSWPAWHRHMTFVFLALHFLLRMRLHFKKKSAVVASSGSAALIRNVATQVAISGSSNGNCSIPPQTKSGCLQIAPKEAS